MDNDYKNIPAFTIYDDCILKLVKQRNKEMEVVMHTRITLSISEGGKLIRDEHFSKTSDGYYRDTYPVKNYEKYLVKFRKNVIDWDSLKCIDEVLVKHNIDAYKDLLKTINKYKSFLDPIKNSKFAQKVFQYFLQVQLEFEYWFWENNIEIDEEKIIGNLELLGAGESILANQNLTKTEKENLVVAPPKSIPSRSLKKISRETCQKLIEENKITKVLMETKLNKMISSLVIPKIEENYHLTLANKNSISDYFRKGELIIKLVNSKLTVLDTYPRINKK